MARVLIADDEKSIRLTLAEFLRHACHKTYTAKGARGVAILVSRHDIDVVVLDILLGDDNGIKIARNILKARPNTQIILITGEPKVQSAREAIQLHVFDYLIKPVNKKTIIEVVDRAAVEKLRRDEYDRMQRERKRYHTRLEQEVAERTMELAQSESRYRNLAENTRDTLCTLDERGNLTYLGPQARRYGFAPPALEGRQFLDIVVPEDRERMAADFQRAIALGESTPSEFRVKAPDGNLYWFEEQSTIQRNTEGRVTGFTGVLRDITTRKDAEMAAAASLRQLRDFEAAVNQGPAVMFRWRIAPGEWPVEMVSANVSAFGYDAEEFLSGRVSWPGITHPDDVPRLEKEVTAALRDGIRDFGQQYRLLTKSGEVRWVEDRNVVIDDPDGTPTHIQGVVLDVTDRKNVEQLLVVQQDRLRHLAAKLATAQDEEQRQIAEGLHDDVAQVLTAASLKLAVLRRCNTPEESGRLHEEVGALLKQAHEKVRRLSFELASSTLHQVGLLEAIEELCLSMEERYGIHFKIEGDPEIAPLDESSATVLFKATRELLFNVVKHAGVKKAIVSLRHEDNKLKLSVEDYGTGFLRPPEDGDLGSGKGLGLFGIRERLRDLGGRMQIESEPGARTCVTLWVPQESDRQ
jgi:PAS domain S-box-containing protein